MKLEDLNDSQREKISEFGVNTWYVLDLLDAYKKDPTSVNEKWNSFFKELDIDSLSYTQNGQSERNIPSSNGKTTFAETQKPQSTINFPKPLENETVTHLRGVGAKIVENMNGSLTIPTATSLRTIPVKVLEENRIIINQYLKKNNAGKISFTHIIGWAIVKAIGDVPVMNNSFLISENNPNLVTKKDVNLGLAIDLEKKDGSRSLIVPNIKKANSLNFKEFADAYNDIVARSRNNRIDISDFQGTTITLTNPGTLGTIASTPRLMVGQGAIIATGSLDYPAEYHAVTPDIISTLGISKVMNITSTYDHRIIQGAESGLFLKKLSELLIGEDSFYENMFMDLQIPIMPVAWKNDNNAEDFVRINNIKEIEKHAKVIQLINMFRVRGHLLANVDPLHPKVHFHPELDSSNYGLTVWDYDREFITDGLAGKRTATLREILDILHDTYSNNIGVEYRHIENQEEKEWLQTKMESVRNQPKLDLKLKINILKKLIQAEGIEKFIHTKYVGHKRFSLEGLETIIPTLDYLLYEAGNAGVSEIVLAMAHRGRLNVLANIVNKPIETIFTEFEDINDPTSAQGSGDVKYHLGARGEYVTINNNKVIVSIASNPSHLESVNPVVEGIVRAKQERAKDKERNKIVSVQLHGDAAFAGQGVVTESINLSQLHGYRTGGTVHIITNNQIGFTTTPLEGRSTTYATDVAKMVQAPIFHVNGEDPESCLWVTKLAFEYKQRYKKDVVIDVIGYRKYGHNEADEPSFTQPLMYKLIKGRKSIKEIYEEQLLRNKEITPDEIKELEKEFHDILNNAYDTAQSHSQKFKADAPLAVTKELIKETKKKEHTHVSKDQIIQVVKSLTTLPEDFNLHPKLNKFLEYRKSLLANPDELIDWSFAEALAFGTLMLEGISVRLSGQDVSRGTFSHRHDVFADSENGKEFIPLRTLKNENVQFEILDSLLSEAAVLGFEYGYSTADPLTLDIWEAQFGDFANGAQIIIDNFIVSSYTKWNLRNSVVLLLPHGQEGQGPEHSSARLERFLTLCAEDNMYVCNVTTASQYFHLLRRQAKETDRKPLIVMSPKSLLRANEVKSGLNEFINGTFNEIITDEDKYDKSKIERILLTSGKIYYELEKHREEKKISNTAIIRIEQMYPYPEEQIISTLREYTKSRELVWVQEEPENMGAYTFMALRLIKDKNPEHKFYAVCRDPSPSPAPGSNKVFNKTQKKLIEEAFSRF